MFEIYPLNKKQPIQQPKTKPPTCPHCKQHNWLEFEKGYYCQNCEKIINKQEHQIDKEVRRHHHNFSTRLPCANKKMREIFYYMANTTNISTDDMNNTLQQLERKTKLRFYIN